MNDVTLDELRPHLVLHLSPERLAAQQGTLVRVRPGREVLGPHYFLLLEQQVGGLWLAAPTFSKASQGSTELVEALKAGTAQAWIGVPTFVSQYQQWCARPEALLAALENDNSTLGYRRTYAEGDPASLAELLSRAAFNDAQFREIAP